MPKDVKPLLRDPRQTSRTGGNSKRHVYAYRGVCRQARKGHDRWQSQISFGGTNHYLGTFDSEWDAAAVYAWAHLILYGEEATKKAQQEGEEAAAAYEREKAAIAAGEVLPPPPKPEKKKKPKRKAASADGNESATKKTKAETGKTASNTSNSSSASNNKSNTTTTANNTSNSSTGTKKKRATPEKKPKPEGPLSSVLSKGVTKAPILASRKEFESTTDQELMAMVATRLKSTRTNGYRVLDGACLDDIQPEHRPCLHLPEFKDTPAHPGLAVLIGLNPTYFGWMVDTFVPTCDFDDNNHEDRAVNALNKEYDSNGRNVSFRSALQGPVCVLGSANEQASTALGLPPPPLGSTVGTVDCHVGSYCSPAAAVIQYVGGSLRITASGNSKDCVTRNGERIFRSTWPLAIQHGDVCTIGARVFVVLLPQAKSDDGDDDDDSGGAKGTTSDPAGK